MPVVAMMTLYPKVVAFEFDQLKIKSFGAELSGNAWGAIAFSEQKNISKLVHW